MDTPFINTGVHPIDYFVDSHVWADCLIQMRELYDFDGILCHKPGRTHNLMDLVERSDYDAETPTLYLHDGSRIECTRDDDAYYKPAEGFTWPTLDELDPEDLLGWAPDSFVAFQASKATIPVTDPEEFRRPRLRHDRPRHRQSWQRIFGAWRGASSRSTISSISPAWKMVSAA